MITGYSNTLFYYSDFLFLNRSTVPAYSFTNKPVRNFSHPLLFQFEYTQREIYHIFPSNLDLRWLEITTFSADA